MLPSGWLEQRVCQVEGLGGLGVLIIGEAPGEAENISGLPFRPSAPAGSVLEKAIRRAGWTRDQFWLTNIVDRRPPKNWLEKAPWEREMIDFCEPRLRETIERLRPRAIVTLGGVATRELTGISGGKRSVSYVRGYVLPSKYGAPVVPSFHPSFLARGQSRLLGLLMRDLATAVSVAQGQLGVCLDPKEVMMALTSYDDLLELYELAREDPTRLIAYDIETAESAGEDEDARFDNQGSREDVDTEDGDIDGPTEDESEELCGTGSLSVTGASIRTIQFALTADRGVSVPWTEGFRELALRVLALPNPKAGQNIMWFDRPILERHGASIEGDEDDVMLMWKAMQPDLPAHLQGIACAHGWPFPWKHMAGSDIEFYGVADVCAIHQIYGPLRAQLERMGLWRGYKEMTLRFRREVLEPMERRGLPVDRGRLNELRDWIGVETDRMRLEIASLVPESMNKVEAYANMPPFIKEFVNERHPNFFAPTTKTFKNGSTRQIASKLKLKDLYKFVLESPEGAPTLEEVLARWPQLRLIEAKGQRLLGWFEPFNPKSSSQMIEYLKLKGYPIPKRFKDGADTTSDKEMQRLEEKTGDPVIKLSRELRVTEKMRDSYTGKPAKDDPEGPPRGGWIPDSDGRLRSTFTFKSTGQLAAYAPNVLTLPVRRKELAERFRRCIRAEEGHKIVELDMVAFHAMTTGLEAQDSTYMRLANLDIHSYVAGHMVKWSGIETALSMSDGDLQQYLAEIKKKHKDVRNLQAKPAILGIGFAMSHRRLYFENREFFQNESGAKRLLDLIKNLFPKIFSWQDSVLDLADRQGYLQSKWNFRRWFWDVYIWSRGAEGWSKRKGKDAEKAIAYLPSNSAHIMLRKKILTMMERGWLDRYQMFNIVHDAVVFHCPVGLVDECVSNVKQELEAPVMELADPIVAKDGFSCRAEASIGDDWAKESMKEVHI